MHVPQVLQLPLMCHTCREQLLSLSGNKIGNDGVTALANACANGALAQLKMLDLSGNKIGDPGVSAIASACASGALAQCTFLNLGSNKIGDPGLASLADACARGALASLKEVVVDTRHERHPQLVATCKKRGIKIA